MRVPFREILLTGGIFSLSSSPAVSQQISFQPPAILSAPAPAVVLIADVNKDGKMDILAAGDGKLAVYLGQGNGSFSPAQGSPFQAGPSPNDLAIGDFNGDGNPDLAVANHGVPVLTILLGDGRGAFRYAPGSPFPVQSNPHPHGIATADFDGDGVLDLVVESWGEDRVIILPGKGDGTFRTPGSKLQTGRHPYQRLRVGDLNEDGHADIVTSNWEGNSVTVLFGDGRGNFARTDFPVPPSPFSVAVGDVNGDRHPDIVLGHYSGHSTDPSRNGVSVLLGDGKGHFALMPGSPFPVGNYPSTVVLGDLDGDGVLDIGIPTAADHRISLYLGGKGGIRPAEGSPFDVGRQAYALALGDLNDDGKADLVVGSPDDNAVLVLLRK